MRTAKDIITHREELFSELPITNNLREHLIRVAAVADTICKHWTGPKIDRDMIVAACLLHDIGNIVKMNFESPAQLAMMGSEAPRAPYWNKRKEEIRAKYGSTPDEVRDGLLNDFNIDSAIRAFMEDSRGLKMDAMLRENKYANMIYLYADNRVIPSGIVTLRARIAEAKARIPGYYDEPKRKAINYEQKLHLIEQAIQKHTSIPLDSITEQAAAATIIKKG